MQFNVFFLSQVGMATLLNCSWMCFLQEYNVSAQRNAAARRQAKKQKQQGFSEFLIALLGVLSYLGTNLCHHSCFHCPVIIFIFMF